MDGMRPASARRDVPLDAEPVLLYASVSEPLVHFVFDLVGSGTWAFEPHLVSELYPEGIAYVDGERYGSHSVLFQIAQVLSRRSMAWGRVVLADVAEIVVGEIERVTPTVSSRHVSLALVIQGFFSGSGEVTLGLPRLSVHA